MATNAGGYFKKYARDMRVQNAEESFEKGQVYANAPIQTGENRALVNWDMLYDGTALTPRRGYRTALVGVPFDTPEIQLPHLTSNILFNKGRDVIEEDNAHYRIAIANSLPEDAPNVQGTDLYTAPAELFITDMDSEDNRSLSEYGIAAKNMYAVPLSDPTGGQVEVFDPTKSYKKGDYVLYNHNVATIESIFVNYLDSSNNYQHPKAKQYPKVEYTFDPDKLSSDFFEEGINVLWGEGEVLHETSNVVINNQTPTETWDGSQSTFQHVINATDIGRVMDRWVLYPDRRDDPQLAIGPWVVNAQYVMSEDMGLNINQHSESTHPAVLSRRGVPSSYQGDTFLRDITITTDLEILRNKLCYELPSMEALNGAQDFTDYGSDQGGNRHLNIIYHISGGRGVWNLREIVNNHIAVLTTIDDPAEYGINFVGYTSAQVANEIKRVYDAEGMTGDAMVIDEIYFRENYATSTVSSWITMPEGVAIVPLRAEVIRSRVIVNVKFLRRNDEDYILLRCDEDIPAGEFNPDDWSTIEEAADVYYKVPSNAMVNKTALTHKPAIADQVGTFAFENDYYAFNTRKELTRVKYDATQQKYVSDYISPKEISVSTAASYGFNMLATNPYEFNDKFEDGNIQLEGIMLYDADGNTAIEPLLNTAYKIRCFYKVQNSKKYKLVWDYRETGVDTWTDLYTYELNPSQAETPTELSYNGFKCPNEDIVIRIRAYLYENNAYSQVPEKTMTIGVHFVKTVSDNKANRELKNYDLSLASGMTYWKNRLWLYGLTSEPTMIFASDINEPAYFPYPNNTDVFDEPVIACVPFNENLLVFTKSQIIKITLSPEGGWTKEVLYSSLNFSSFDARFIQIIKNMVFFKSGNYYYMIVPKALSLQNELAIAPVSRSIEHFLDNIETNITDMLKTLYDYDPEQDEECTWEFINHYNFLSYEDVYNVYTIKMNKTGLLLNIVLLYNTVNRTWRTYTYESENMYYPLNQDATHDSIFMAPLECNLDKDSVQATIGIQFLEFGSRDAVKDFYIPSGSIFTQRDGAWIPDEGQIQEAFDTKHTYKNWQLLDTGYRKDNIDYNKRYRELQIKFNNLSKHRLGFITEFLINGDVRVDSYKYTTEQVLDPTDPNYGYLYISRTPVENLFVYGPTTLAQEDTQLNYWTLDHSAFPTVALWKARLKVSGKGLTPRFKLVSRNEEQFELLGYTWVYRQMYSR